MLYRQFSNEVNLEKKPVCFFKGHKSSVQTVEFLSASSLLSGDHAGYLCEWDLEKNSKCNDWIIFNKKAIWSICQTSLKSNFDAVVCSAYNQIGFLDKRNSII